MTAIKFLAPFLLALLGLLAPAARAQENWQRSTAPATAHLWSVAFGDGQWVAVGEQGTILTSPDAVTWTPRVSNFPTRWLVAVGYGAGAWVVVGEGGLLLTSPDAVTWTARTSGTTARLNGVAYGGNRWMAVAESGELITATGATGPWNALRPSGDRLRGILYAYGQFVITGDHGLMRTTIDATDYDEKVLPGGFFVESVAYGRRAFVAVGESGYLVTSPDAVSWTSLASDTSAYLRGVTFFNGQFIAVGTEGVIRTTPAAGSPWTARDSGSTAILTAVAAGDSASVAVGFGGTILRSAPPAAAPVIVVAPADRLALPGDQVLFRVTATGSPPLAYQWRFNGTPLAGQTSEQLLVRNVQSASVGAYSVTVTNSLGTVTSALARLTLDSSTGPGPIVDSTFTPTLTISPGGLAAAVEQADGKLVIGGSQFFVTPGVSPFSLARLNGDGSLDPTFRIGTGPNPGSRVTVLVQQSDGRILVAGDFTSFNNLPVSHLLRLNADGSVDSTFVASNLITEAASQLALQSDGKILVVATRLRRLNNDGSADVSFAGNGGGDLRFSSVAPLANGQILVPAGNGSGVARLLPDGTGTLDPVFSSPNSSSGFVGFQPAEGGKVYAIFFTGWALDVFRLNADGTRDTGWAPISAVAHYFRNSLADFRFVSGPDGKSFLSYKEIYAVQVGGGEYRTFSRFNADGSLDTSFNVRGGANGAVAGIFPLRDGRTLVTGSFTAFDSVARPGLARLVAANASVTQPPVFISVTPEAVAILPGQTVNVTGVVAGSGPITYSSNSYAPVAANGEVTVPFLARIPGTFTLTLTARNSVGSATSAPVRIVVGPSAPVLLTQPSNTTAAVGSTVVLSAEAVGSPPFTYQWFRGSTLFSTNDTLAFSPITTVNAGEYSVVVTNSLGSTRSRTFTVTVDAAVRLANLSTRATAGTGDRLLIAGFVVGAGEGKKVLIRGVGPGLASFGLTGLMPDPTLTVRDAANHVVGTSDNFDVVATPGGLAPGLGGFPLANRLDAALVTTLAPGSYTVQVADTADRTGLALVEIYVADDHVGRLINLSTRAFVDVGSSIAIGGISVQGETPRRFLVRGIGPALSAFGVAGALADPVLTLTNATGTPFATNDNWSSSLAPEEIADVTTKVGAFALTPGSKDSALVVTLGPGNYTALLSGVGNTTGVALIEVYEVP